VRRRNFITLLGGMAARGARATAGDGTPCPRLNCWTVLYGTTAIHVSFNISSANYPEGGLTLEGGVPMKQFWLVVAAALLLTTLIPDGAFAQRGGFRGGGGIGGGFRGAAIGGGGMGGGFRGAAIGGGFRGAAIGGGFRGAAIGGGFRGAAIGGGFRGAGIRTAAIGPGFRGAVVGPAFRGRAISPGFRTARAFPVAGFRRRAFPFAVGAGLGLAAAWPYYYSAYYSDPCVVWDPYYGWVNACPYYPYY
jgi:hypothetical protein